MTTKGKKTHHGEEESEPSSDLHALLKVLMESNARAEADRKAERAERKRGKREKGKRHWLQQNWKSRRKKQLGWQVKD